MAVRQSPPSGAGAFADAGAQSCLNEDEVLRHVIGQTRRTMPAAVMAHLDACARCQTLVAEAARAQLSGGADAGPSDAARTLRIGDVVLDRYEVVRFIGAGGMGEVYEALDRDLGERIALKTVTLTTLDDQRSVARLKGEVQLARRTTHPNVCRIFDFAVYLRRRPGLLPEPIPLLTMELLAGETLAQYLARRGRLDVNAARPIVAQILAGLAAVHRAEIVHRDLKAENVFLVAKPDQEQPRVVLMDFGLARPALPTGTSTLSSTHALVGTVSYMAPEQVEGHPVSFASDVYAVGVLMFEMVTGRLPFMGGPAMKVALQRLREKPPRPTSLVPDLDPLWEHVILKCLSLAPADRYQSVDELAQALVEGSASSRLFRRRGGRKRAAYWAAALALAAAASALVVGRVARDDGRLAPDPIPPAVASSGAPTPAAEAPSPPSPEVPPAPAPAAKAEAPVEPPPTRRRPSRNRTAGPRFARPGPAPAPSKEPAVEAAPPPAPTPVPPASVSQPLPTAPTRLTDPDGIVNPFSRRP